jgi:hypothetical protein
MSTGIVSALKVGKEKKSKWRFVKYGWEVLKNLFYFWLVFLAFGKMNSVFQTLVLALLVLIFQSVGNTLTVLIRTFIEEAHVNRSLFLGLYKKFDDPEVAEGEEALSNLVKDYHKSDPIFYINSAGNVIVFVYVLSKIIEVIVLP